jgi:molybdopterin/thiamine biosynthesis adenylyltransferase
MGHKNLVLTDSSKDYPDYLKKALSRNPESGHNKEHPVVIKMDEPGAEERLREIADTSARLNVLDTYGEQYAELLLSKHAHLYRANYDVQVASIAEMLEEHYKGRPAWSLGSWVYFPWKSQLVHILDQHNFEDLRSIRNRDLISREEQKALLGLKVASFGMSVGSAGALAMAISGISRQIKLIDGAVISGSNLNRILTGVESVGKSKALVIGQQIYEMNPYSEVAYYDKVGTGNINEIFDDPWDTDIAIDEIDDIEMKVLIRYEARKRRKPVLMASELGDTVVLDVERYDLEPDRPLLHGIVPDIEKLIDNPPENYREWTKHAVAILDPNNMPLKMQESLLKIGTTIATHPQLGSTVMMTGGVLAFAAKNIALGNSMHSGRYVISLEDKMLADHKTRKHKKAHKKHTKVIKKAVDSM